MSTQNPDPKKKTPSKVPTGAPSSTPGGGVGGGVIPGTLDRWHMPESLKWIIGILIGAITGGLVGFFSAQILIVDRVAKNEKAVLVLEDAHAESRLSKLEKEDEGIKKQLIDPEKLIDKFSDIKVAADSAKKDSEEAAKRSTKAAVTAEAKLAEFAKTEEIVAKISGLSEKDKELVRAALDQIARLGDVKQRLEKLDEETKDLPAIRDNIAALNNTVSIHTSQIARLVRGVSEIEEVVAILTDFADEQFRMTNSIDVVQRYGTFNITFAADGTAEVVDSHPVKVKKGETIIVQAAFTDKKSCHMGLLILLRIDVCAYLERFRREHGKSWG